MIRKFMFLTGYSIKKKIKSKSFIITNIILLFIVVAITNIDSIIKFFGGDFNEDYTIYVVDKTGISYDVFKNNYENINGAIIETPNKVDLVLYEDNIDTLKEKIEKTKDVIVVFQNDETFTASIISYDYIDLTNYQTIYQSLNRTKYDVLLNNSSIDKDELAAIEKDIEVERIILNNKKSSEEETINSLLGLGSSIVLLPVFMLIMFLIQIIGGEINEEKTTRSMEIIISNVDAKTHLFSHLIADNVFILVQSVLLGLYGFVGTMIKSSLGGGIGEKVIDSSSSEFDQILNVVTSSNVLDKLTYVIPVAIILLILSFFAYSLIAAVLASMSTNLEDYQQVQTPIVMILLAGFYLSLMSSLFDGSTFIKVTSYIPLLSCMINPTLLITDTISLLDSVISIIILLVFDIVIYIYGLRIYKVGILNYSSNKLFRRMFKAMKK